jgi:hypothetical protein
VITVVRKDTGKVNVPDGSGNPRSPTPRLESEAKLLKDSIGLLRGEVALEGRHCQDGHF